MAWMLKQDSEILLSRALGDELVVLDRRTMVAHQLDATAAAIFRACDGQVDARQLAERTGVRQARVEEVLTQLTALDLLVPDDVREPDGPAASGATRRVALGKLVRVGVGLGVGVPAITSMVLPTAAQAFSSVGSPGGTTGGGTTGGTMTTETLPQTTTPITVTSESGKGGKKNTKPSSSAKKTKHPSTKATTPSKGTSTTPSSSTPSSTIGTLTGTTSKTNPTLPFTGDDMVTQAMVAGGAIAAGIAIRRVAADQQPKTD